MRIKDEAILLDEGFRKDVIEEIEGQENSDRKAQMKKRYDIYKDNTAKYVLERVRAEQGDDAVLEMENRLTNLSIARTIINKKSLVYKAGVIRTVSDEDGQENQAKVDQIEDIFDLNSKMKKVNKYVELFKNCAAQIVPYEDPETGKWRLNLNILQPYLYDVIEDHNNPEIPRCYIFSYYKPNKGASSYADENEAGRRDQHTAGQTVNFRSGDGHNQIIADSPSDSGPDEKIYVWWSTNYHFTTNEKGQVIPGMQEDDLENPIGMLPFVNFSKDQDGSFWAIGGEDIIDGSIVANLMLSDINYIIKYQGQGVFYMFGKGIPQHQKVGPSDAIFVEVKNADDPTPQIGFASSNPPIDALISNARNYIAFLLSTNNMNPGTITGDSQGGTSSTSGFHEMLRRAEIMEDIEDQQEMYKDNEPRLFKIIFRWINYFINKKLAHEDIEKIGSVNENVKVALEFLNANEFMTEQDKLDIIERRKELGLDTIIDSIMRDNTELSEEEAIEKYKKMLEFKQKHLKSMVVNGIQSNVQDETESEGDDERSEEFIQKRSS